MKIYHIDRQHGGGYDEYYGFIVIAESEEKAKEMVLHDNASEYLDLDLDKSFSIREIGETDLPPEIVMEDFHAG